MEMSIEDMTENTGKASALLKSMSNQYRLMILCLLSEQEMTVGELLEKIPLSQSALSQHLAMLRREDIVKTRRDSQFRRYSLASEEARVIIGTLYSLFCAPEEDFVESDA